MNTNTIRIAWTFDDGPTEYTPLLIEKLKLYNIHPVTWFICRHHVYRYNYFKRLQELQEDGAEIGIHEIHPSSGGVAWLRRASGCYHNIRDAITDLATFHKELAGYGIPVRFVRLPGGELSELIAYLKLLGCPPEECYFRAGQIIDQEAVPEKYACAKQDFEYLLHALDRLNVKIWAGAPKGYPLLGGIPFHYNSWQAECAGIAHGRGADNITLHQSAERKAAGIVERNAGVFEKTLDEVKRTSKDGSIVILAHDTTLQDINEILADTKRMEHAASRNGVRLEYTTMTGLYNTIR